MYTFYMMSLDNEFDKPILYSLCPASLVDIFQNLVRK